MRTVVDLRMDAELEADPPAELPVDVLHFPFFHEDEEAFAEVEAASAAAPDNASATRDVYLVFLERFRANVAAAFAAVARAPEGAVVVHCMGGKDRTGLLVALLLRVAGVDDEQIAADYALSEERLRPRHEAWLAEAGTEAERERIRRIAATPAESMLGVLDGARASVRQCRGATFARAASATRSSSSCASDCVADAVLAIYGPTASGKTAVAEADDASAFRPRWSPRTRPRSSAGSRS